MFQRLKKLFLTPTLALIVTVTMSLGLVATAQAAQPTYQPTFNPNQHVYLDPLLENGNPSVNLNGLEQKLIDEGKKHNIDFYFVMAQKGSEPSVQGVTFAKGRMDDMLGKWLGSKNFNSSRYVILYLIRLDTDWTKSSYAINPAPALASEGITGATMLTVMDQWGKTNSPSTLLPRSPRDFAAKIASEANRLVDEQIASNQRQEQLRKDQAERQRLDAIRQQELARQAEQQRIADAQAAAERNAQVKQVAVVGGPIVLLLIIFGFLFFRFSSAKSRATAALADWRKKIEPASANLLQLDSEYLSFLMSLSANFVGETQVALTSAKTDYGTLSARIKKAIALSNEAERLIGQAGIFSVDKLTQAAAMLTSTKITVTGDDIPIEQRSLFSGMVSESSFTPSELLQDMDQLFSSASKSCASIMQSYKGAETNKQDIINLLGSVSKLQGELSERGLPFTPYEASHAAVTAGQSEFMGLMATDPLRAYTKSEAVEHAVEALKALITRAIELRDSVKSTDKAIATAQAKVDAARAQKANYKWVEPVMSATALPENNLFAEEGGNPDVPLKAARDSLASCLDLLSKGSVDAAQKAKQAAEDEAGKASALVDTVLAARDFVLKEVVVAIAKLKKLRDEIPAADTALATLKAEFLAKNFEGQPAKVTRAHTVADTMDGELAKVRKFFFEQRYLAARAEVEETGKDIDGARNGVVEVLTRLKTLEDQRNLARATVKSNLETAAAIASKLQNNAFTTSAKTDEEFARIQPLNRDQKADVARDITDWVEAAAAAGRVTTALKAVDTAIDDQRKAYELAKSKVSATVTAVGSSRGIFDQRFVRQTADAKYTEVQQRAGQLDSLLRTAKSDWNALTAKVESIKNDLDAAIKLANSDQQAGEDAEAAIAEAGGEIRSIDNKGYSTTRRIGSSSKSFGSGISADVSSANGALRRAQTELAQGNYEAAARSAASAKRAAEEADAAAQQQVAAAIAIAVSLYEAEQERIREAERERQREAERERERERERQREADRQSSSSSSSSSSWGSDSSSNTGTSGSDSNSNTGTSGGGDF